MPRIKDITEIGRNAESALSLLQNDIMDIMEYNGVKHIMDVQVADETAYFRNIASVMNALIRLYSKNRNLAAPFIEKNEKDAGILEADVASIQDELEKILLSAERSEANREKLAAEMKKLKDKQTQLDSEIETHGGDLAAMKDAVESRKKEIKSLQKDIRLAVRTKEQKELSIIELNAEVTEFEQWNANFDENKKQLTERYKKLRNHAHCLTGIWRSLDEQEFLREVSLDPDTELSGIIAFTERQFESMAEDIQARLDEFQRQLSELIRVAENTGAGKE